MKKGQNKYFVSLAFVTHFTYNLHLSSPLAPQCRKVSIPCFRYSWVSKPVANNESQKVYDHLDYHELIPLETDGEVPGDTSTPRLVVGHNVSFDRAKIKEQYWLEQTGNVSF